MSDIVTNRARKKAYFSDLDGGHIVDFQFTPDELTFVEGGRFSDRIATGQYLTDYIWISGKPNSFNIKMWVDRTQESMVLGDQNTDPFSDVTRFPKKSHPRFTNFDVVSLIRGINNSDTSSGFASTFAKKSDAKTGNAIDPSKYSATPDFKQDIFSENKGVYYDVENLMYYVRPKGFSLAKGTVSNDGSIKISDYKQTRFTPPPMVRFYYGNLWSEGYIEEIKYSLTAMNKQLVPRRLEADITFIRTNWGYLDEVGIDTEADDYIEVSNSPRYVY